MTIETDDLNSHSPNDEQVDMVNHPPHYKKGIETIKIIRSKLTTEEYIGYLRGTLVKYVTRMGYKGQDEDMINDVGKIIWYATELQDFLKEKAYE